MIPAIIKIIPKGSLFLRSREHYTAGELFNNRRDLKYPPVKKAKLQRANWNNQPMFYASYVSDPKAESNPDAVITILYETSDFVRNECSEGIKEATISLWKSKRDLEVFVLPTFNIYPSIDEIFELYNEKWEKFFEVAGVPQIKIDYLKNITEKFAQISENEDEQKNAYKITAEFVNLILANNLEIDGIMYPSARLKNEKIGVNIVFRPEICDKWLDLIQAHVAHFFKPNIKQEFLTYYMETTKCGNTGKIKYKMCKDYFKDIHYMEATQESKVDYLSLELKYNSK